MSLRKGWWIVPALAAAAPAFAEQPAVTFVHHTITVDSGIHDGTLGVPDQIAYQTVVQFPGAGWMRVKIQDYNLGQASYIILRPASDPQQAVSDVYQRLDARSLPL